MSDQLQQNPEMLVADLASIAIQLKEIHQGLFPDNPIQLPNNPDNPDEHDDWIDVQEYNGEMGDYLSSEASQKLEEGELDNIPLVRYEDVQESLGENLACSICFMNYEESQDMELREIQCGHYFHQECLDPWILEKPYCPLCKFNIKYMV